MPLAVTRTSLRTVPRPNAKSARSIASTTSPRRRWPLFRNHWRTAQTRFRPALDSPKPYNNSWRSVRPGGFAARPSKPVPRTLRSASCWPKSIDPSSRLLRPAAKKQPLKAGKKSCPVNIPGRTGENSHWIRSLAALSPMNGVCVTTAVLRCSGGWVMPSATQLKDLRHP